MASRKTDEDSAVLAASFVGTATFLFAQILYNSGTIEPYAAGTLVSAFMGFMVAILFIAAGIVIVET